MLRLVVGRATRRFRGLRRGKETEDIAVGSSAVAILQSAEASPLNTKGYALNILGYVCEQTGVLDKLLAHRGVYPRVRGQNGVLQQAPLFQPPVNPVPVGKKTIKMLVVLPKDLAHGAEALEGGLKASTRRQALRRCAPHRKKSTPFCA